MERLLLGLVACLIAVGCGRDVADSCNTYCKLGVDQCASFIQPAYTFEHCLTACKDEVENQSDTCKEDFVACTDCWHDSNTCAAPECTGDGFRFCANCTCWTL